MLGRAKLTTEIKRHMVQKFPYSYYKTQYKKEFVRERIQEIAEVVREVNDDSIEKPASHFAGMAIVHDFKVEEKSVWISRKLHQRQQGVLDITIVDSIQNGVVGYYKVNLERFEKKAVNRAGKILDYHQADLDLFLASKIKIKVG